VKYLTACAGILLCNSASAATYVYQTNPNQGHSGRCGRELLPFQLTITVQEPFPLNADSIIIPLESIYVNAGGKYQWGRKYNKKHTDGASITTDSNGNIIGWDVSGAKTQRVQSWTHNISGSIEDIAEFKCGTEGSANNPGTWTRTE
jgi:hypothetical protein